MGRGNAGKRGGVRKTANFKCPAVLELTSRGVHGTKNTEPNSQNPREIDHVAGGGAEYKNVRRQPADRRDQSGKKKIEVSTNLLFTWAGLRFKTPAAHLSALLLCLDRDLQPETSW